MENTSTEQQLNKLTEFRQVLHRRVFTARRDAVCELLDALVLKGPTPSFPLLSGTLWCQRSWCSLYQAVEEGQFDRQALLRLLAEQVPLHGVQVFALDGTAWPRPQAHCLPERGYVYHPTQAVNGGTMMVGYAYSLLAWVPYPQQSWALGLDIGRVSGQQSELAMGVEQVQRLAQARPARAGGLDIVVADAKYGNQRFFGALRDQPCGVVAAMRRDRVLYHPPPPSKPGDRGRSRVHGPRFAFKDPPTWSPPQETVSLQDERWGQVELRRWNGLHDKSAVATPFDIIQAQVHLEKAKPPQPLWLAWQAPSTMPSDLPMTAESIWRIYQQRWPIEASIRFRKRRLMWTTPQFQSARACDCWSVLVNLAVWLLYLSRSVVTDRPLPWQAPQVNLTPARVQCGMGEIFAKIGTPVRAPQTRGKSPGWPKGKARSPRTRHPVVKRGPPEPKSLPLSA